MPAGLFSKGGTHFFVFEMLKVSQNKDNKRIDRPSAFEQHNTIMKMTTNKSRAKLYNN